MPRRSSVRHAELGTAIPATPRGALRQAECTRLAGTVRHSAGGGLDAAAEPVVARDMFSSHPTRMTDQAASQVTPPRDDGVAGGNSCDTSSPQAAALAAKPLTRQRRMLPAVDDDDAWQDLLVEKKLPSKDERLSTILSLAADSTFQVARRPNRDGAAHVELLDAAQELVQAVEARKAAAREDERRTVPTDQSPPSPHARRRHGAPAAISIRTTPERFEPADYISSVLSGLETKLRQSLGETASAVASLSARPATTPTTARAPGSPVKALARSRSPQRPSTARDAGLHGQYQAWRNLAPTHAQDPEEDQIFRGWAEGAGIATDVALKGRRGTPTRHCEHGAAAKREALRRVKEQVAAQAKAEIDRKQARHADQCGEWAPVGGEAETAQVGKTKCEDEGSCKALSATSHPARVELIAFPKLTMPPAAAMELEPVPSAMAHFNSSGIPPRFPCVPLASEQPLLSIDKLVLDSYVQALLDDTLRLCAAARVGAPALPLADDGLFDDVAPTETQQLGFEIFQMLVDEPCAELSADGQEEPVDGGLGAMGTCWHKAEEELTVKHGQQGSDSSPTLDLLILNHDGVAAATGLPHSLVQGGGGGVQGTARGAMSAQLHCEQPQNVAGTLSANLLTAAANGSGRIVSLEAGARRRGSLGGPKHSNGRSKAATSQEAHMGDGPDDIPGLQLTPPTSLAMVAQQPLGRETLSLNKFSPGLDSNEDGNGRNSATRLKMRRISEARAWGELAPGSPRTLSPRVGEAGLSKVRSPRFPPPPPLDNFLSGASVSVKPNTHPAPSMPTPEPAYEEMEPRRFTSAPRVYVEPSHAPSSPNAIRLPSPDISVGLHVVRPTRDGTSQHSDAIASGYASEAATGSDGDRTTSFLSLSIPTAIPKTGRRGRARY